MGCLIKQKVTNVNKSSADSTQHEHHCNAVNIGNALLLFVEVIVLRSWACRCPLPPDITGAAINRSALRDRCDNLMQG